MYDGTLGAVTGTPSGASSSVSNGSAASAAYINNSYQRTSTLTVGLDFGNFGTGIKSCAIHGNMCSYQYEFDTAIPKDNTKVLTLTGTVTWARA